MGRTRPLTAGAGQARECRHARGRDSFVRDAASIAAEFRNFVFWPTETYDPIVGENTLGEDKEFDFFQLR